MTAADKTEFIEVDLIELDVTIDIEERGRRRRRAYPGHCPRACNWQSLVRNDATGSDIDLAQGGPDSVCRNLRAAPI